MPGLSNWSFFHRSLLIPLKISFSFMAFNTIHMLMTPKWVSPAPSSILNSRPVYPAFYSSFSLDYSNSHSNSHISTELTSPHTHTCCSHNLSYCSWQQFHPSSYSNPKLKSSWIHPWLVSFSHILHPIYWEFPLSLSSKYNWNLTTSH